MQDLRANTEVIVSIGPFVDVTDGKTPETGVTLGAADEAELLKHGSTTVVDISAAAWAAITSMDGYYALTITAALSDTEGMLRVVVQDDDVCLPVKEDFMVLAEAAYDSKYTAKDTGLMDVNVSTINNQTVTAGAAITVNAEVGASATAMDAFEDAFDGTGFGFTSCVMPTTTTVTNGVSLAAGAITDASLAGNMEIVFETDFATNYSTARDAWVTNTQDTIGTGNLPADVIAISGDTTAADNAELAFDGTGYGFTNCVIPSVTLTATTTDVTNGVLLAAGAITNASLAGNMEIVFETDFATNYSTARDAWVTNVQDTTGTGTLGLNDLSAADVNAEVVDALATDTYAEPSAVPAATASLADKINWVATLARNKITQTSSSQVLRNDGDGANIGTAVVSDDNTTWTREEWV